MAPYRVLIVGASSLLGKYLKQNVPDDIDAFGTHYCNYNGKQDYHLDVLNVDEVNYVFMYARPNAVIHLAAIGSVDFCEKNSDMAERVNVDGTRNVIGACRKFNSKLVYVSTNAVFDGSNPPYKEEDERNPLSMYGMTKKRAEDMIFTSGLDYLLIRTARLFGRNWHAGRDNWIDITINRLRQRKVLEVVTDDIGRPTYAGMLADVVWKMVGAEHKGTYHVAGEDVISMYDFVCLIARYYSRYNEPGYEERLLGLIKPVTTAERFPHIAARPPNTAYNLSKLHELGMSVSNTEHGLYLMGEAGELL